MALAVLVGTGMAKKLEDLPVYQRAVEFCTAVIAILDQPRLRNDRDLHKQISDANDSITSNMEEGFEQSSDRAFARYLVYAKGSVAEVLGRLRTAKRKRLVTQADLSTWLDAGEELGRMLGGFIRYLDESDFKDRGRHGPAK